MSVLNTSRSAREIWEDKTLPLWRRTQLRLALMETWCVRQMNTSDGFDERIQLQHERIALASRHLVLILKELEQLEVDGGRMT